jgi:hypothetical protein
MKFFKYILITYSLLLNTIVFAKPVKETKFKESSFNIRELALPSEVEGISKTAGAIYYSPSVKGKALMPIHFWGQVQRSGLHFIPVDTSLLNGLSLAGGPKDKAILSRVMVTTKRKGKRQKLEFDLEEGGGVDSADFSLRPGDTVYLKKDTFTENRNYYTSLIGVVATILSSILLYREVKR